NCGIRRADIADAFPDREEALFSGFGLMLAPDALASGHHLVSIEMKANTGHKAVTEFSVDVRQVSMAQGPWMLRRKMPLSEIQLAECILTGLSWRPVFGLLLGIGEGDEEVEAARRTLASLRDQTYGDWRTVVIRRGRVVPDRFAARLLDGFDDIAGR